MKKLLIILLLCSGGYAMEDDIENQLASRRETLSADEMASHIASLINQFK